MLLESQINKKTRIFIDCESSTGFNKDDASNEWHPDQVLNNVVRTSTAVAEALASAVTDGGAKAPAEINIAFGLKVSVGAQVSVAKDPNEGQFRVNVRWRP